MNEPAVPREEIDRLHGQLRREAEAGGYHLNPDDGFARELVKGLLANERRYGYRACPCRLAAGNRADDLDIICPCDYRDPDVAEHNACYCALYVSGAAREGKAKIGSIPERRPPPQERPKQAAATAPAGVLKLPLPVWRCKVCGYLCARDGPPEVCPVCKATRERFERFI